MKTYISKEFLERLLCVCVYTHACICVPIRFNQIAYVSFIYSFIHQVFANLYAGYLLDGIVYQIVFLTIMKPKYSLKQKSMKVINSSSQAFQYTSEIILCYSGLQIFIQIA